MDRLPGGELIVRHRVTFNETRLRVLGLDDPLSSTDWDRKV